MLLIASVQSYSMSTKDVMEQIPEDISVKIIKSNLDGSFTFEGISVVRESESFYIGYQYTRDKANSFIINYDPTCKLLGFDKALSGSELNKIEGISYRSVVELNRKGEYSRTTKSNNKIGKITCYNQGELKTVVHFDKIENEDGSKSLSNIEMLRGDKSFYIGYQYTRNQDQSFVLNYDPTCKLLDYGDALRDNDLNEKTEQSYIAVVELNENGEYCQATITFPTQRQL